MQCRIGCAACCIAPSISSAIPGMPNGKPAGVRCSQLTEDNRCQLFASPERPLVCSRFQPRLDTCGNSNAVAFANLQHLELATC